MLTKQPSHIVASSVYFPIGKGHVFSDQEIYFIIVFLFIKEYQGTFQFKYHVLLSLVQVSQVVSRAQSLPRLNS